MSAMGNGQCPDELLHDGMLYRCILPKGHESRGIPHRTAWVDGHQHNWRSDHTSDDIVTKEGQPITNIGDA